MLNRNGPLLPSPPIWLPSADSFGLDAPNSSRLWHVSDKERFAIDRRRLAFMRHHHLREFPSGQVNTPPLWVLVVKLSDWHLRIPIWRGPNFFSSDLPNDAAVMLTVSDCIAREWCDRDAIDDWYKARNV
jgi:hypothetical protein